MRHMDLGGIVFGLIVLGVGGYFLARNTLGLTIPDLNWDQIWPLFVVALGVSIIWSGWNRTAGHRP